MLTTVQLESSTIYESKGLEYEDVSGSWASSYWHHLLYFRVAGVHFMISDTDEIYLVQVILYNFFTDSLCDLLQWRHLLSQVTSLAEHPNSSNSCETAKFDAIAREVCLHSVISNILEQ